jgi:hypothetical protein
MSNSLPEFPDVDPSVLASIVEFAKVYADWLEMDASVASQHGHDPKLQASLTAGWRFVAEALAEQMEIGD